MKFYIYLIPIFLCLEKTVIENKWFIRLRQIELGFSYLTIMWVDDRILAPDWENKQHMEQISSDNSVKNIRFIPKENTETALSFLRSPFGKRLTKLGMNRFRIVSDMTRLNEIPSHNAGARFYKRLRDMGIKNQVLIFTSNEATAKTYVEREFPNGKVPDGLTITVSTAVALRFLRFE